MSIIEKKDIETIWGKKLPMYYRVGTNDTFVIDSVMVYDEYKAKQFVSRFKDNDVFIDLGSHIGTWSILMASLNPSFKVYSVEATPENYAIQKMNVTENKLETQIRVYQNAISNMDGKKEKIFFSKDPMHKYVGSMLGLPEREGIQVESLSLNKVFEENNIEHCRIIKTDCEGAEVLAFSTLKKEHLEKVDVVVGEFHPYLGVDRKRFFDFFEPYFIDLTTEFYGEQTGFGNFLYMNRKKING